MCQPGRAEMFHLAFVEDAAFSLFELDRRRTRVVVLRVATLSWMVFWLGRSGVKEGHLRARIRQAF